MDRVEIYGKLADRVKLMRLSEEQPVFETYEQVLYDKLSSLTDAVFGGMIDLGRAEVMLERFIISVSPQEGVIRY